MGGRTASYTETFSDGWLVKTLGTYCAYTTAYHLQANGQTERMNRTLLGLLRKFCSNYPEHWPKYLDILNFSYNNSTSVPPHDPGNFTG